IPALQIHTSRPPHSRTVASATASLNVASVTSPLSTNAGPGIDSATATRSFSVRATSTTRAPPSENACATSRPRPRPAPGITTRLPVTSPPRGKEHGISICSAMLPSRSCTDQYSTQPVMTNADLLEMYRRMLVIRGFEQRVAALYRDGEVPGFVHLSIGQEASAVGACWPLGPADVITSTHRGHGHCLAKGLDPLGMVAELMGPDPGT